MKAKNRKQYVEVWTDHLNWMNQIYYAAGMFAEWPAEQKRIAGLIEKAADNEFPVLADDAEVELIPKYVYDGEGRRKISEIFTDWSQRSTDDTVSVSAAAPGIGKTVYRITRITEEAVYGVILEDTVRILSPSEVV